jgi:hypothetical protein
MTAFHVSGIAQTLADTIDLSLNNLFRPGDRTDEVAINMLNRSETAQAELTSGGLMYFFRIREADASYTLSIECVPGEAQGKWEANLKLISQSAAGQVAEMPMSDAIQRDVISFVINGRKIEDPDAAVGRFAVEKIDRFLSKGEFEKVNLGGGQRQNTFLLDGNRLDMLGRSDKQTDLLTSPITHVWLNEMQLTGDALAQVLAKYDVYKRSQTE